MVQAASSRALCRSFWSATAPFDFRKRTIAKIIAPKVTTAIADADPEHGHVDVVDVAGQLADPARHVERAPIRAGGQRSEHRCGAGNDRPLQEPIVDAQRNSPGVARGTRAHGPRIVRVGSGSRNPSFPFHSRGMRRMRETSPRQAAAAATSGRPSRERRRGRAPAGAHSGSRDSPRGARTAGRSSYRPSPRMRGRARRSLPP